MLGYILYIWSPICQEEEVPKIHSVQIFLVLMASRKGSYVGYTLYITLLSYWPGILLASRKGF